MKEDLSEVLSCLKEQPGRLFVGDTENTLIQFFRYCFVGGIATVFDWGISYFLFSVVFHGDYAVLANSLSFVAGLAVNYVLSTCWIFKNSVVESRLMEFLAFAGIGVVGLLLTALVTKGFTVWLSGVTRAYQILAKITSTALAFLWNFFARKYLLYNGGGKDE